jgi:hypothetical protein
MKRTTGAAVAFAHIDCASWTRRVYSVVDKDGQEFFAGCKDEVRADGRSCEGCSFTGGAVVKCM